MEAQRCVELTSTNSPCVLYLNPNFLPPFQYIHRDFLAAMERRVHPIPFRTRQLSSPSPMILQSLLWESRSPPSLCKAPAPRHAPGAFDVVAGGAGPHAGVPLLLITAGQQSAALLLAGDFLRLLPMVQRSRLDARYSHRSVQTHAGLCVLLLPKHRVNAQAERELMILYH